MVIDLAVPGTVVCMENKRCMAVDVKNPNMTIRFMLPE